MNVKKIALPEDKAGNPDRRGRESSGNKDGLNPVETVQAECSGYTEAQLVFDVINAQTSFGLALGLHYL